MKGFRKDLMPFQRNMDRIIFGLLLFFVFFFMGVYPTLSAQKAFLVGIEDYKLLPPWSPEAKGVTDLVGPVNDVRLIKKLLIERFHFNPRDIKVLTNREASYRGIREAFFNWLIKGTKPGDLAIFYFSGHGSRVRDLDGDEEDGFDEVLCPYDIDCENGKNLLLDDELGAWLRKLSKRTVVVMIDSCHSGGATRGVKKDYSVRLEKTPMYIEKFLPIKNYKSVLARGISNQKDIPEGVVFFAASKEDQVAGECKFPDGEFYGGFTYSVVQGIKRLKRPTYKQVYQYSKEVISELRLPQEPLLEAKPISLEEKIAFSTDKSYPYHEEPSHHVDSRPRPSTSPRPHVTVQNEVQRDLRVRIAVDKIEGITRHEGEKILRFIKGHKNALVVEKAQFFDRILRGYKKDGVYHLRFVNGVGDAEYLPPSSSIKELLSRIDSFIEKTYYIKRLSNIHNPNPPFEISIETVDKDGAYGRRNFRVGETISFKIKADKTCHLILFDQDSEGNIYILFPNRYNKHNVINGAREIIIPSKDMGFYLQLGEPAGMELVKAICTTKPIDIESLGAEKFEEIFRINSKTRAILVKKVKESLAHQGKNQWTDASIELMTYR